MQPGGHEVTAVESCDPENPEELLSSGVTPRTPPFDLIVPHVYICSVSQTTHTASWKEQAQLWLSFCFSTHFLSKRCAGIPCPIMCSLNHSVFQYFTFGLLVQQTVGQNSFPEGFQPHRLYSFGYTVSRRNPSGSWCSHSTVQTQSTSLWEYRKGTHKGNTEEWAYPCILAVHKNAEVFCVKWYSCGFNYVFDLVWSDSLEAAIKILAKAGSPDQISCLQVFPSYLKLLCSDTDHLENNFLPIFHINPC